MYTVPKTNSLSNDDSAGQLDTFVFSGQVVVSQNAPLTPLYQLNRELTCARQRNMAMIFESIQFTEVTNPDNTTRKRRTTEDLYYLVHPLNPDRQFDLPEYYVTAASPGTLGNIQLDITKATFQVSQFKAMLNRDKSAVDALLFNRDTQELLFDIKLMLKSGQYEWVDTDGQRIAHESSRGEEYLLHLETSILQEKKDALVALWIVRLWHDAVEKEAKQTGESTFGKLT